METIKVLMFLLGLLCCGASLDAMERKRYEESELGRLEYFAHEYRLEQKYVLDINQVIKNNEEFKRWRSKGYYPTIWGARSISSCLFDTTSRYLQINGAARVNMVTGMEGDLDHNIYVDFNFVIDTHDKQLTQGLFFDRLQQQERESKSSLFLKNKIIFSVDRYMAIGCASYPLVLQDIVSIYRVRNESQLTKVARLGVFYWLRGGIEDLALSDDKKKIALVRASNVEVYTLENYLGPKTKIQNKLGALVTQEKVPFEDAIFQFDTSL
jgi:hypothetical protein